MATLDVKLSALRADAHSILSSTLADCGIDAAIARTLRADGARLHRLRSSSGPPFIDLALFSRVFVVALGKAAVPMLDALLRILPHDIDLRGVCAAPALPLQPHSSIAYFAAGHPLPNADSFAAARAALDLLHCADDATLIFFLISGGGSALCEFPLDPAITLADVRAFHQALIGCGAPIAAINAIRQSFSAVKGGRLADAAANSTQYSLFVSDVPGDALEALASGPNLPPQTTPDHVASVLNQYHLLSTFPPAVRRFFEQNRPQNPCHPAQTILDPVLHSDRTRHFHDLVLSADDLAFFAARHARSLGYAVTIDNNCDDWDYAEAARYLTDRLCALHAASPRCCLVSTGEVTVELGVSPGIGGRNQQFTLAVAELLAAQPWPTVVLSVGTDGIDGNSLAAGALADRTSILRASSLGIDPRDALIARNTYPLFQALGDAIHTGPTGNNLRDLRVLLTAQ